MGKRLSKIYTRTGDEGQTGLGDGNRIAKNHARIEAIGTVDEFNSTLGLLIEEMRQEEVLELNITIDFLRTCQHRVFDLGGELSIPGYKILSAEHVTTIETELDTLNEFLNPLENFILPGGSKTIAQCHMARSICRRAERCMVSLNEEEKDTINSAALEYINRLSDYLFVVARYTALKTGIAEVLWHQG